MELAKRKLDEVLAPCHVESYRALHKDIWDRVTRLRTTLIILKHMAAFPFEYMIAREKMVFWFMVHWNFVHSAINLVHGLIADTASDTNNLRRMRNRILNEWIKPDYKAEYRAILRKTQLDQKSDAVSRKVTEIRHNFVAHSLLDTATGLPKPDMGGVHVSELDQLCKEIEVMFGACSFGTVHETKPLPYMDATVGGEPIPTDIEELLDLVAENSGFVNAPEQPWWSVSKETLSPEELGIMNKYRKRFGMPEA